MWCVNCRQDVVGVKTAEAGRFACPRCKAILCDRMATASSLASPPDSAASSAPQPPCESASFHEMAEPPLMDTWEVDWQLRRVARLLGRDRAEPAPSHARLDPAQPAASGWHRPRARRDATRNRPRSHRKLRIGEVLVAVATWFGVATLTCGACLLAWSEVLVRAELQPMGLAIAVGGILLLAIGMTLRLGQTESNARALLVQHRIDPQSPLAHRRAHLDRSANRRSDKAA